MPLGRSRSVDGPRALDIVVAAASVVLIAAGFVSYSVCGGGLSFVLFGAPAVLLGLAMGRYGALALIIPCTLIAVTLIGVGLYIASVSGCFV
jgi:hypothetical protein